MRSPLVRFLGLSFLLVGMVLHAAPAHLLCEWREDEGVGHMPAIPGLDGAKSFTLSIRASWNKSVAQTGYPNLLSGHGWGGAGSMLLFVHQNRLSFRVGSSKGQGKTSWHENEASILRGGLPQEWTTITVTFQRPLYRVYLNGREVSKLRWDEPFRMGSFQLGSWGGAERHDGRLDDLRVYDRALDAQEVAALAAEKAWQGRPTPPKPIAPAVVLDGAQSTLVLDQIGRISSLKEKSSGRELIAEALPFLSVSRAGRAPLAARRLEPRDGNRRLAFVFPGGQGEAIFRVDAFGANEGWTFTLESISVPDVEEVFMAKIRPVCTKWCGTMANILSDEASAVALRAYDVALSMSASRGGGLQVNGDRTHGFLGMRFGLAAGPRACFIGQLRAMSKASGAPLSESGGAWSLGAEACRGSYMFADLSLDSVEDWIDLAERGGIEYVHLHGWWEWLGQYPVRKAYFPNGLDDMKAAVDKIHAAGLKVGMHSLTACINPYRDPWISPVCSTDLVADASYTLAAPLTSNATEIVVHELPVKKHDLVFTYSSNGNFLRLGNEIVQYTGIRREKPYAFTGCRRGYFKTRPAAYPAGERCDYLHQRYIAFYPEPDSPLADDLATRLANVRNVCGIDSFYFDGSEGMGTRYGIDKLRHLIYGHFTRPPVAEASCWGAHNWWFHSRVGAWDHTVWGAKRFHDAHLRSTVEDARMANFMEPQMGWWQPRVGSAQARGHFSEEMEYFAGKNAGFDAAMSQQGVNVTAGPLSEFLTRQFTLLGWYERARLAHAFTASATANLAMPGTEWRLRQDDGGVWTLTPMTGVVHRVTGPRAGEWAFSLPRPAAAVLRVEALYGVAKTSEKGTNFLTSADVPLMKVESAGGVMAQVEVVRQNVMACGVPSESIRLAASNSRETSRGAWASVRRNYEFPYMSLGDNAAFGFWVKGDGSGAVLNLQLRMAREYLGGICEHYVKLDFKGWRYVTLLARERDADAFAGLSWPYSSAVMAVHRNPYDGRHVKSVSLWLNEIPAKGSATVEVTSVRALPVVKPVLREAVVLVDGTAWKVPFALAAGEYAELEGNAWIHYSETGESLARAEVNKSLHLNAGVNACSFAGERADGGGFARAEVTILALGASEPAFGPLSSGQRRLMAYEAMLPFRHAPAKGLAATLRLAIRPGEEADLDLVVHGPAKNPTLDFGDLGRFTFPVDLKADERLACRDGRTWRVLAKPRREVSRGVLVKPLPTFKAGRDWTFRTASPATDNARVEVVKRYRQ